MECEAVVLPALLAGACMTCDAPRPYAVSLVDFLYFIVLLLLAELLAVCAEPRPRAPHALRSPFRNRNRESSILLLHDMVMVHGDRAPLNWNAGLLRHAAARKPASDIRHKKELHRTAKTLTLLPASRSESGYILSAIASGRLPKKNCEKRKRERPRGPERRRAVRSESARGVLKKGKHR